MDAPSRHGPAKRPRSMLSKLLAAAPTCQLCTTSMLRETHFVVEPCEHRFCRRCLFVNYHSLGRKPDQSCPHCAVVVERTYLTPHDPADPTMRSPAPNAIQRIGRTCKTAFRKISPAKSLRRQPHDVHLPDDVHQTNNEGLHGANVEEL